MSDDFDDDGDSGEGLPFLRKLGVPQGMDHLVITFGLVAIFAVGFGAYWFGERIRVARGGHSDAAHVVTKWDHDAPIFADVNGDGQEDLVGVYAGEGPGGIYIGAFDGKDGKILWRHGVIDIERPARGGLPQFGRQGDLLLINEKTKGTVIGLKDGKVAGSLPLPSARMVCAGESASAPLLVGTSRADEFLEADLTTRSTKPSAGRRECQRTMATAQTVAVDGLTGSGKLAWALKDGESVVGMAHDDAKGSTLHGYSAGGGEPKWSTAVAPESAAQLMTPRNAFDLAGGRVFVGYWIKSTRAQHVVGVDANTGKELWRVPLESPGSFITGLSASSTRVYVAIGDYLVVLDGLTGKVVLDLGTGAED